MEQDYVEKQVDAKIIEIQQNQNIFDVGTVINVKDFIIEVAGMENVMFYEKINIANKAIGYVVAINEYSVNVAVLKINAPINVGDMVYSTNALFKGHFSPSSTGRIIDLFGEDKLNSKKFSDLKEIPIERKTIPIMDRTAVCRPLLTGIAGIDLMYPIGKGQRQLIIGDKRTGKTQIGLDTIVNQNGKNVMCFYVAIGKTKKEVKTIYNELAKRGAISYTTIITAFNDELPPVLSLIPYFALSVAEDYMMEGYDVLVVIDDLKRHAEAYREISLISGKTPGRDAYPADIFYTHSRLLEKGCQHMNGGSITILPIVETKGGDITDYISTNIISITDGQIVLSSKSFQKGEKPAIDYGLSVSRLGGAVQEKSMKAVGTVVRRKLLSYLETRHVYELVNMDEMSTELKNQFMEGKFILDNLNQYKFSARTPEEMRAAFTDLVDAENNVSNSSNTDNNNDNNSGGTGGVVQEVSVPSTETVENTVVEAPVTQEVVENIVYQEPVTQEVVQEVYNPVVDNNVQVGGFEPTSLEVAAINDLDLNVQEAVPISSMEVINEPVVTEVPVVEVPMEIVPEVSSEPVIEVAYEVQPEDVGVIEQPVVDIPTEEVSSEPVIEVAYEVQPEDVGVIEQPVVDIPTEEVSAEPVIEVAYEVQPEDVGVIEQSVVDIPTEEVSAEPVIEVAYEVQPEDVGVIEQSVVDIPTEEVSAEPVIEAVYEVQPEDVGVIEQPVVEVPTEMVSEMVEEPVMDVSYDNVSTDLVLEPVVSEEYNTVVEDSSVEEEEVL